MCLIEMIKGDKRSNKTMDIGVETSKTLLCSGKECYVARVLKDRP